jgi:hypothetical protein
VAFDAINDVLNSSEADRKDAIKNGKAVFGITLKNPAGETESWFIDLAKEGKVVQGLDKSDGTQSPRGPRAPRPFSTCLVVSHPLTLPQSSSASPTRTSASS